METLGEFLADAASRALLWLAGNDPLKWDDFVEKFLMADPYGVRMSLRELFLFSFTYLESLNSTINRINPTKNVATELGENPPPVAAIS